MPDPRNPDERQGEGGQDNLPGTDFYESEGQDERGRGEKIGSTFEGLDRERRDRQRREEQAT